MRCNLIIVGVIVLLTGVAQAATSTYFVSNGWNPNSIGPWPSYSQVNSASSFVESGKPSNALIQGLITVCFYDSYSYLDPKGTNLYFYLNGNPYSLHLGTPSNISSVEGCYSVTPPLNTKVNSSFELRVNTCTISYVGTCPSHASLSPWTVSFSYIYPQSGTCGSANGQYLSSAPTTGLCSAGNATTVSGSGPWSWTCYGTDGGGNQGCSANIAYQLTVTKTGTGTGTVTTNVGTISWNGTTGTGTYNNGTEVSLTATPDPGKIFTGWSGACSGKGTCTVTMDTAKSVTANFVPNITPIINLLLED